MQLFFALCAIIGSSAIAAPIEFAKGTALGKRVECYPGHTSPLCVGEEYVVTTDDTGDPANCPPGGVCVSVMIPANPNHSIDRAL